MFGHVWDEPEHIAVGMVLIERGQYLYDDQHPPLARLAASIGPILGGAMLPANVFRNGETVGRSILYDSPIGYDRVLGLARSGMLPFLALLIGALWYWMSASRGPAAAWLACAFLLSAPPILGHAGVVALDLPVTALCTLSFYLLQRWTTAPTAARALALGLATGLAVSTKMSAIPFIGITALGLLGARALMREPAPPMPWRSYLAGSALVLALTVAIGVAVYGTRLVPHSLWPWGAQELALNLQGVAWHNAHGHPAFLLGQTSQHGWWYFYLVALAVKTPLPLLGLGLVGLAMLARDGWRERRLERLAPPLIFVLLLAFCCAYSHINIGVRHVLVLYPLLAIGAAAASRRLWEARRAPWARILLAAALLWQFSTIATAYPDYLAYFNGLAGMHPENILVDSDLDWGQDLRRLSLELARRHVPALSMAYRGSADLSREHLPPLRLLAPGERATGWVAIDMLALKESGAGYAWLAAYRPLQRVGKSIDLYFIPPDGLSAGPAVP